MGIQRVLLLKVFEFYLPFFMIIVVPFLYTTLPLTLLRTRFFHHQFPYKTKNLSTKMKFAFRYLVSTCLIYKENLIFTIHETIYESFQASIFSWPVSCFSINLNKKWMFFKFSINWLNFLFLFFLFFFFMPFSIGFLLLVNVHSSWDCLSLVCFHSCF